MRTWKPFNSLGRVVCCVLLTLTAGERAHCESQGAMPKRLRRADSFFGIHFDLHAHEHDDRIGENVTRQMVENIVAKVRPDYLQCDCKGHPGISSYPTRVGNRAAGYVGDQLKIWRDVTAEYGVALYVHYSGVWDNAAVKHHPEWARVDEKGNRDNRLTSVFGPYVDKLLIPQLKELRDRYRIDGVWVDGECWAVAHDYSPRALEEFQSTTGVKDVPRKPSDPHYDQFTELCRQGFRRYFNHYVTELHRHDRDFQICGNWAFSSFMPEPVSIPVDFLSGDFSPNDAINSARWEGRCLASQSDAWDLMSWSFYRSGDGSRSNKSATQLKQEAAVVLALGGGYQAYFKQKRDCSIYDWQVDIMAEVAKFCRARQRFCHKAQPVPQVALLYSGKATYRAANQLFGSWGSLTNPLKGVLHALLNSQYCVEILCEHHLTGRMKDYPLVVIPEWDYLPGDFKTELLEYVKDGGNLLIIGPGAAALLKEQLGVEFKGKPTNRAVYIEHGGHLAGLNTLYQAVELEGAQAFGRLYKDNDFKGETEVPATIVRYGKGRIAAVYFSFGQRYLDAATAVARDYLASLVRELFAEPIVEVAGSHYVDVTANRIDGKLTINIVNTAGPHADDKVRIFDDIPQVGPLTVTIRTPKKPNKVTLQPANRVLNYNYSAGKITLTLGHLAIHDIIVVQ